jgi:hypothetical protein
MKHQDIEITKLEIEEFLKEEVANITIKLLVDTNSHYWNTCNKLCQEGELFYFEEGYFIYEETVDINPATRGILGYLKDLKEGKSYGDAVIASEIIRCIKALDNFWN